VPDIGVESVDGQDNTALLPQHLLEAVLIGQAQRD
jgi:hypothetical protein